MSSTRTHLLQGILALVLALVPLWAATQWAAAPLAHDPALGPWLTLLGAPVYAPWTLFPWWLAFDAQAPDVFAKCGLVAALGGVLSGTIAVGGAAWRAGSATEVTTYGSALVAHCGVGARRERATRDRLQPHA